MAGSAARIALAVLLGFAFALVSPACGGSSVNLREQLAVEQARALRYPPARRGDVVDDYHGTEVADPYRWLEDPDSTETRAWIEAENALTFRFLGGIAERPAIRARVEQLWDHERYGVPVRKGERYFFTRNDGLQDQSVFYVAEGLAAAPRPLIDPNTLSEDGTVAVNLYRPSRDGALVAYGISSGGSDWMALQVRDVATGEDTGDHLRWVKFSGASWNADSTGFYYSRYDEPPEGERLRSTNYFHKLYFHRVGTPQSEDVLVYERPDHKEWGFGGFVTEDGRYLVIAVWQGTDPKNGVFYLDLGAKPRKGAPKPGIVELLADFDASYDFIGSEGPIFWFQTDLDAPRGRVIAIDIRKPQRERWTELVAEDADTLQSVSLVGDRFVLEYLHDAHSRVVLRRTDGSPDKELALPGLGSTGGFSGERADRETFYVYTGFTAPAAIYRYDFDTGESSLFKRPDVDIDPDAFVTRQVFYASKDGTKIPMFVTHARGIPMDGSNPTYLYGYGGFKHSLTPYYSPAMRVWMEMGGIFAVPNIRGGGEYGEAWHQAGIKDRKQNVFDDFIAAAEWLIREGYTSTPELAIAGGSNGGLLVGACMVQRPDLFGAALPAVGVLDMLRFHEFTIGWAWVSDYGSADVAAEFPALYAYSPLHNLRPGTAYPATLITTGDHDDRVVPAHSFKFAAEIQHDQAGPAPTLIRIETRAGHGAGKPTTKRIDEVADKFAFLVRVLHMKLPAGFGGGR